MFSLKPCKTHYYNTGFLANLHNLTKLTKIPSSHFAASKMLGPHKRKAVCVRASSRGQGEAETKSSDRRPFLTLEEAGLVEISGLSTHERFLCRLTISSLNLLRVISEQEGCPIEELNAGKVCDWFVKDKLKREQKLDTAVLQWDDSELF